MGNVLAVRRRCIPGLAVLLAATLLAGCGKSPVATVMATAQQMIGRGKGADAALPAQPAETGATATSRPILHARIAARGLDADLTVRDHDGDITTWADSGGTTFTFRNGILIETRGLGFDVMSATAPDPAHLAKVGVDYRRTWFVTAADAGVEQRVYTCRTEAAGPETSAGQGRTALHLRETCLRDTGKLTSDYWLDGGIIRKSRQWAGPGVGHVEFEMVKD